MFFFSLAIFAALSWNLPWWWAGVFGFAMGAVRPMGWREGLAFCSAAAVAWAALAYVQDGRNFGLISQRMSGLIGLPHPLLIFALMAGLGFLTVFFCLQSGQVVRGLFSMATKTPNSPSLNDTNPPADESLASSGTSSR
ncbi:MAG: hypothetical protein KF799_11770 [Bdellovibrionales bacterium]|nr:hypothetical protein [Bdellovibrionales bacterium]